ERFLQGGGDTTAVDRRDRVLLQPARERRRSARVAGRKGGCHCIRARRKRLCDRAGERWRRGRVSPAAAAARAQIDDGGAGGAELKPPRSGLPPMQASAIPVAPVRG